MRTALARVVTCSACHALARARSWRCIVRCLRLALPFALDWPFSTSIANDDVSARKVHRNQRQRPRIRIAEVKLLAAQATSKHYSNANTIK